MPGQTIGLSGPVEVEAPLEKLKRLKELEAEVRRRAHETADAKYREKRAELLAECPHPLALAQKFDQNIVLTDAMEMVSKAWVECLRGRDGRLTISVPPQQGKSLTARWAIFWALLDDPDRRIVFASYGMALARTSGRIIRNFVEMYGGDYGLFLDRSHRDASDFQLDGFEGGVLSAGVGSSLTGRPSDLMVLDDLLQGQAEANSETIRENVEDWWETVARTRMAPGTPAVAIGTRWHELDILSKFVEQRWDRLNIPALADGHVLDSLNREVGEYLVSTRGTTPEDWQKIRAEVGERAWSALFQGNPTPPEGGIFKRAWFENHRIRPPKLPPKMREVVVGVDPAETGTGDEAGILIAGQGIDGHIYLLADESGMHSQYMWARKACLAWITYGANRVIQERTLGQQGSIGQAWSLLRRQAAALLAFGSVDGAITELQMRGDTAGADLDSLVELVPIAEQIIDAGAHGPRLVTLTPRQSKTVRAEAATQPFEIGRAHIVGHLPKLELEAVTWQEGEKSPNRLDVLSLVINHLDRTGGSKIIV